MTSTSTLGNQRFTRGHAPAGGVPVGPLDPFVVPSPSNRVADAALRSRVVLDGVVLAQRAVAWAGGPVCEVTISDGTGDVCLAFLGRQCVAGIAPGRSLTVAGTIGSHDGRAVLVNPQYWLHPTVLEA